LDGRPRDFPARATRSGCTRRRAGSSPIRPTTHPLQLDGRRELGVIVKKPKIVATIPAVFEDDWSLADRTRQDAKDEKAEAKVEAEKKAVPKAEAKAGEARE
jgi:hypothetical protein